MAAGGGNCTFVGCCWLPMQMESELEMQMHSAQGGHNK